jgi:hypothetical protein
MKFLLILLFALPVFSQSDLQSVTTYRVEGDAEVKAVIAKTLAPHWKLDESSSVVVEYKPLSQQSVGFANMERGQLTVYVERDGKRVELWAHVATGGAYKADTAKKLAKKLRSALKKSS